MLPGLNPRKVQQMMRQMGIQPEEIPAWEVVIRTAEKDLVITRPSVFKVNMMGQETFQVSGEIKERTSALEISEEDIKTVQEQTGADEKTVRKELMAAHGDLAQAILNLQKGE